MPSQLEHGLRRDGYPALAAWMSRDPDDETLIFRRFKRLAARNTLHIQAKLVALEKELDNIDDAAWTSGNEELKQSSRRWETLMSNDENQERVVKLEMLQVLLKEYYDALLQQSQMAALQSPRTRPLDTIREFVDGSAGSGEVKLYSALLAGRARRFLQEENDLVALADPIEDDHLSRFLQNNWLFRSRQTSDPYDRTVVYKNAHVVRTVAALGLILAAVLLIGAIITLYLVTQPAAKLGLVAMYTVLFASSVALCTNARRAEVFAATAAYAAVLVVFVSGDLGGTKSEQCLVQLTGGAFKMVDCTSI